MLAARLSLLGFCGIVALSARRVPGAALIGMLGVSVAGLVLGVSEWQGIASLPPDPTSTLLALDMAGALQAGMVAVILTFLIVDRFDTTGVLIGGAYQAPAVGQARTASAHAAGADRRLDAHGGRGASRRLAGDQTASRARPGPALADGPA